MKKGRILLFLKKKKQKDFFPMLATSKKGCPGAWEKKFFGSFFQKRTAFLLIFLTAAAPPKVVSLNLCTDQLLVLLAPDQIIALSPLARDPALSVVANRAAHLPWVRPDAEAVLTLHPTLVLAGEYGAQGVLPMLRRHGVPILQTAEPTDFPGVALQITQVAAALGVPDRGKAMIAAMRAALPPQKSGGPTTIFWQARGYTAGPDDFGGAILRAAGLRNAANGGVIDVESLATHPPDVLITEMAPGYPSLATDLLNHPALRHIARRRIDPATVACPGPWSVAAVRALAS
jgi:iron complex transport system substrate-binding protein